MKATINRIPFPEVFIGFVSPIGADIAVTLQAFTEFFQGNGYTVVPIKVTEIFSVFKKYIPPDDELVEKPLYSRYERYISYGNKIRKETGDDAALGVSTIVQILRKRLRYQKGEKYAKTVFLIYQFKRREEVELFRIVYGRLFFQVSVYSRRGSRVDYLSREFARSENVAGPQKFRDRAESIIQKDENEIGEEHGQRVAKIFHDADFIVNKDSSVPVQQQVTRFCELIFGSNSISPTKHEYGMFMAKAAALRTLDLSRQVGAAIFSPSGEIISLGSNEVPKAGGGTYWCDEPFDDREYRRGRDSNLQKKRELLAELAQYIDPDSDIDALMSLPSIRDSQFMDALEYGRIVHAEMSAISDAARLARSTLHSTLFCTTFPCHMCAKHIVAAGISDVIFLEPYPKSLAFDLHTDSIEIEGGDRGRYKEYPSVRFEHFCGITPRRYREIFERGDRRSDGIFQDYLDGRRKPIMNVKFPFYATFEEHVLEMASNILKEYAKEEVG